MANMSYCRFENTSRDLADCVHALECDEKISEREMQYVRVMRTLCEDFIAILDRIEERDEDEY